MCSEPALRGKAACAGGHAAHRAAQPCSRGKRPCLLACLLACLPSTEASLFAHQPKKPKRAPQGGRPAGAPPQHRFRFCVVSADAYYSHAHIILVSRLLQAKIRLPGIPSRRAPDLAGRRPRPPRAGRMPGRAQGSLRLVLGHRTPGVWRPVLQQLDCHLKRGDCSNQPSRCGRPILCVAFPQSQLSLH